LPKEIANFKKAARINLTVRVWIIVAKLYLPGVGCCLSAAWVFGDTSLARWQCGSRFFRVLLRIKVKRGAAENRIE